MAHVIIEAQKSPGLAHCKPEAQEDHWCGSSPSLKAQAPEVLRTPIHPSSAFLVPLALMGLDDALYIGKEISAQSAGSNANLLQQHPLGHTQEQCLTSFLGSLAQTDTQKISHHIKMSPSWLC